MKEQIKIEYLSPYLPYGLEVRCRKSNDIEYHNGTLCELTYKSNHSDWATVRFEEGIETTNHIYEKTFSNFHHYYFGEDVIIPVLRQIEDLTRLELQNIIGHLFRDTRMIRPQMESVKQDKGFITFYDLDTSQTYVAVKPSGNGCPVLNMSNTFEDYGIFFKMKVDMFDLIGKGLAIKESPVESA